MFNHVCCFPFCSKDAFRRKITRIYEEVNEQMVEDEFEFLTEKDMRERTPPFSEKLW